MLELTTADVYEQASIIGQDIEKIIDSYGHEAVMDLMPRVVKILEQLELLVCEREKEKLETAELKMENERLYFEIKKEVSHRRKLDEELYQAKNNKKDGELKSLKSTVAKLQEENLRLRMEYEISASEKPVTTYVSAPGDAELMQKLKETIDTQRDVIRSKNLEIEKHKEDVDAMEEQVERLVNINESLRKNLSSLQSRVNSMAKEKAEYEAELEMIKLERNEEYDSQEDDDEEEEITDDVGVCIEEELARMDAQLKENPRTVSSDENHEDGWETVLKENEKQEPKTVDRDPNRPRYTKAELQEILTERNRLKEECFSLREELSWYKPSEDTKQTDDQTKLPRQSKNREESGISKIFSIFTSRKSSVDAGH